MSKIFLTGCAGFIGSNLVHKLTDTSHAVYGVDNLDFGYAENLPKANNFAWSVDDFSNEAFSINSFDILIHCATQNLIYSSQNCLETFHFNALETIKLFERFKGKIIYTSTASVYNNAEIFPTPEDAEIITLGSYDKSKYIAELYLKQRGNYTILRLSNVYGKNQHPDHPYSGVIGKMIGAALKGEPIKIYGDGNSTRDYTAVEDTVDAIIKAIELPATECPINVATSVETSANDLCKRIWKALDKPQKYTRETPRSIDFITRRCLDISRAEKLLGWKPVVFLEEGIKKTIEWQKSLKASDPNNSPLPSSGNNESNKVQA